jgi:hypothetical protein
MKPHKNEGSTPAGVPHLQEVGYTVTYEDEYLKQLRAEIKAADVQSFIESHNRIFGPVISSEKGV